MGLCTLPIPVLPDNVTLHVLYVEHAPRRSR